MHQRPSRLNGSVGLWSKYSALPAYLKRTYLERNHYGRYQLWSCKYVLER